MKRIVNSASVRSVTAIAAAAMFVVLALSARWKVSYVSAASTEKAKAEALFKTEAVRDENANQVMPSIPAANLGISVSNGAGPADKNDTPESMMAVGKEGLAEAKEQAIALNDITALMNRLSTDRAYATKLLEAIKKGDSSTAAALLKETMTRSGISVIKMKSDFHLDFEIHFNSYHGRACISSDGSCDGHNVTLG